MAGCHEFHVMDVQQNGVFVCPIKNCTKPNQAAFCFTDQCRYKVREVYTTHCNFIYFFNSCLFPVSLVPIHIKICHFALQHPYIHISISPSTKKSDQETFLNPVVVVPVLGGQGWGCKFLGVGSSWGSLELIEDSYYHQTMWELLTLLSYTCKLCQWSYFKKAVLYGISQPEVILPWGRAQQILQILLVTSGLDKFTRPKASWQMCGFACNASTWTNTQEHARERNITN